MVLKIISFFAACAIAPLPGSAQAALFSGSADTSLQEVVVRAFNSNMRWKEVPAAVAVLSARDLQQSTPVSFVPVMNTVPGVRMEERSPGSYRLSLRGSLLRSPFGVRNIKVYWNDIPLTDATGNTYINLLDLQQVSQVEIAKGPAASVYGAGTGGAVLFNQPLAFTDTAANRFRLGFTAGSYGLNQQQGEWQYSNTRLSSTVQLNRLQSEGYRDQSALLKSGLVWQTAINGGAHRWNTLFFYTDLSYGTPGGITAAQMQLNPRLSRQSAGGLPGALEQKAAIYNQTVLGAVRHQYRISEKLSLKDFISLSNTRFSNPFITNYEKRNELNISTGLQLVYQPFASQPQLQWINGMEWMINEASINNFDNRGGIAGAIQYGDMIYSRQGFFFSQLKLPLGNRLTASLGFSMNHQAYQYKRLSDPGSQFQNRTINAAFVPRMALSYRITNQLQFYALAAEGFSSPSLAELRPSDGNFYPFLNAERGWNMEAGIKGFLLQQRLSFDLAYYRFLLRDAIARRTDAAGAEYFVNAGNVLQQGVELMLKYRIYSSAHTFIQSIMLNNGFSYQPYRFKDFRQGTAQLDGKQLTGVPEIVNVLGIGLEAKQGWYLNATLNTTGSIPLNDANSVSAGSYELLQAKLGKAFTFKQTRINLFLGADNLLNQRYSLGNDINAFGNRYFNPAPARNWYAGIRFGLH